MYIRFSEGLPRDSSSFSSHVQLSNSPGREWGCVSRMVTQLEIAEAKI